jgi:myo-inositol-1(or 4)-monophosphatase
MTEDLQTYLEIATEAALAGGAVVMSYQGKLKDIREKGRPGDIVTEADKGSEAVILEILQRHFPDHGILAEESGKGGDRQSRYQWAIDPLDGTTNYSHGYPNFSVSIGLCIDGVPQVGVVFDPSREELFRAAQGLGATLNREAIAVSATPTLADSLLVTGFAYDRRETDDNNYAEFCHFTHLTQGVRRGGSAAIDLAYIACGRLDGYWERGLSPWDMTAGIVLVQEAGGKISAYDGSPIKIETGRILATNGHLHDPMIQVLSEISPFPSQWRESAE